jgi:flagellar basal body-associated protein FliL
MYAAPPPKKKRGKKLFSGFMLKLWAVFIFAGLVLAGIGGIVIFAGLQAEDACQNNAITNSNTCSEKQDMSNGWNAENDTTAGTLMVGLGFLISGIGFGLFALALIGRTKTPEEAAAEQQAQQPQPMYPQQQPAPMYGQPATSQPGYPPSYPPSGGSPPH